MADSPASTTSYANSITEILIGGGVLTFIFKQIESYIQNKRTEKAQQAIVAAADIYDSLNLLKDRLNCARVSVNYTSNGGGIPEPGKSIYYSMLYEVHNFTQAPKHTRVDFQNILLDEAYVYLLRDLLIQGYVEGNPSEFKEGMFKQISELEGMAHVLFLPIYKTELRFYYLVIQWQQGTPVPDDTTVDVYSDITVKAISNVLKKSK